MWDVDKTSEISEEARARAGPLEIIDTRKAKVSGDIWTRQSYSTSKGLFGTAYVEALGASGTADGWSVARAGSLNAAQNASLTGGIPEMGMVLGEDRSLSGVIAQVSLGSLASRQSIAGNSNSMNAYQDSTIDAKDGQGSIKASSNFKGWEGIKTWEISGDEDYRRLPEATRLWTEPSASDAKATVQNGLLKGEQYAVIDSGATTSQRAHLEMGEIGSGQVEASSSNGVPGLENICYVFGGNASYLAAKSSGTLDAVSGAAADFDQADVYGWSSLDKRAMIFEPVYNRFKNNMTTPPSGHPDEGSEGDIARCYLAWAGFQVWRYTDAAATRDKLLTLDDYDIALISSHMTPDSVTLNSFTYDQNMGIPVEDEVAAVEIEKAYQDPHQGALVVFDGCFSAGPQPGTSPLFNAVGKAAERGGTITGYERMVDINWAVDSTGQIFEDLYGGMTIAEANNHAVKIYAPWWVA